MHKDNDMTMLDISHLYRKETIAVVRGDDVLFEVTIAEIPHGKVAALQAQMFSGVQLNISGSNKKHIRDSVQREVQNVMQSGKFSPTEFADRKTLLGIESWTLTDKDGNPVPVCYEVWQGLPHFITEQIEKGVEWLNPDLDEDFPNESGSNGTTETTSENSA